MGVYLIAMVGHVFDIVGAFLLAAEAIKPQNLRSLRDKWMRPIQQGSGRIAYSRTFRLAVRILSGAIMASELLIILIYAKSLPTALHFALLLTALALLLPIAMSSAFNRLVALMNFIDHRTEDGGVGIWGFILIFIGFVMQFTADTIWMWRAR